MLRVGELPVWMLSMFASQDRVDCGLSRRGLSIYIYSLDTGKYLERPPPCVNIHNCCNTNQSLNTGVTTLPVTRQINIYIVEHVGQSHSPLSTTAAEDRLFVYWM